MSNRTHIVTDEALQAALDFLCNGAQAIGNAKAELVRASHMLKVVKALRMKVDNDKPISHQEREALASEEYLKALERDAVAAGEYEKLRALREAASLKIEAWRSEQANYRALRI